MLEQPSLLIGHKYSQEYFTQTPINALGRFQQNPDDPIQDSGW